MNGVQADFELAVPRSGDHEASALFYRQTAPGIHAYLRRLCGRPHRAEDLLQETFLAVFRGLCNFEGGVLASYSAKRTLPGPVHYFARGRIQRRGGDGWHDSGCAWRQASLLIHLEHERAHYLTKRVLAP